MNEEVQQNLIARLKRIEGQVRGIRRMVQEPRRSVEILQQLAAAEAALQKVSRAIVKYHVGNEVPAAVRKGGTEQEHRLAELVQIFGRYART
jgi:DNA-binding FrmR family transcriptional regulator